MKRVWAYVGALVIAIFALTAGFARSPVANAANATTASASTDQDVLQFQTMFGDQAPFIGPAGSVSGVPAAGLPWMIHSVHGDLDLNGELTIDVHGLVLADSPAVPAALRGTNPVPFFAAIVSCTTAVHGVISTVNVMTANVPATMPTGNAHIDQRLMLPRPCVAPIVMVTAPGGAAWFSVTGT
jgi:hypothetical protein